MNKFHIFKCFYELWSLTLDFDQKVKVWLFSIQSNFDQLTGKFICQSCAFGIFWTCWTCQGNSMGSLSPYMNLVCHWLGQTVKNCLYIVKTLILTILPFWWFDQISWGVVIQTWSNGSYESKILLWIKNWLYTEKSNFDFLVKIKCQGSFFIKMCQNMKRVHQEIQFSKLGFKVENFLNLEFF